MNQLPIAHSPLLPRPAIRGFTLVELVASMVVIGTLAAVAAPLVVTCADAYNIASTQRESAERVSLAMDRVVRLLREAPTAAPGSGQPDITRAEPAAIEFGDGTMLEQVGSTLWMATPGQEPSPLCLNVELFELTLLASDGMTDVMADPTSAQRVNIRLSAGGAELRTGTLLRAAMGGE